MLKYNFTFDHELLVSAPILHINFSINFNI
jgi:hypothetical protein